MIDESIFKAYDIRGVYPDQLDEDLARDIGRAFVSHLALSGSTVLVARDMRHLTSATPKLDRLPTISYPPAGSSTGAVLVMRVGTSAV